MVKEISNSKLIVKKSKFFAHLFSLSNKDEIKDVLEFMNNKYNKSIHICYGAIIDNEEIFKNDSEVGYPGKILLNILKNKKLENNILIVARFYGGIKLGPSGVGRAFREAGNECF